MSQHHHPTILPPNGASPMASHPEDIEFEMTNEEMSAWLDSEEGQHVNEILSNLLNGLAYFWVKYREGEHSRTDEHHLQVCANYQEVCALLGCAATSIFEAVESLENPPLKAQSTKTPWYRRLN